MGPSGPEHMERDFGISPKSLRGNDLGSRSLHAGASPPRPFPFFPRDFPCTGRDAAWKVPHVHRSPGKSYSPPTPSTCSTWTLPFSPALKRSSRSQRPFRRSWTG